MSNLIDEFFKNSAQNDKLVVSITDWHGQEYIDIHWHFKPDGQEDFFPTKKGVSLSVYHLGKLRDAIENVIKQVEGG